MDKTKSNWNIAHEPLVLIIPPHTLQLSGMLEKANMYLTRWPPCPYPNATYMGMNV